jgi:NodT family efflux transporter outer membrane factor (OMF) lipoprotein
MKKIELITLSIITFGITSCSTAQIKPAAEINQAVKEEIKTAVKEVGTPVSWATEVEKHKSTAAIKWLEAFNDPILLKLIEEGKNNNLNLKVTAGNMDKAWLLSKQAGAQLEPTLDASLETSHRGGVKGGSSSRNISVGLTASWEADIWGRLQSSVDASQSNAQSAKADYVFAQHSLGASIAKAYFKVIETKQQSDISQESLELLQKNMRITKIKHDNGMSSGQDIALNRAELASVKEKLTSLKGSQRDALRALEVLLGRYPDASLDIPNVLPELPANPPAGLPSEMLERRPDLVSAERQIASAFHATQQAKTAHLPKLSLTAGVGGGSRSLSDVLNPANLAWQLASSLLMPLYDGGKRKIDIKITSVEQKQAIDNYAEKALTAFSEVENNLDKGRVLRDREVFLNEVLVQRNKAYTIANLRYKEGESDLLDTLTFQQKAIAAKSNLLSIKRLQLEQRVNLYLALGGSW